MSRGVVSILNTQNKCEKLGKLRQSTANIGKRKPLLPSQATGAKYLNRCVANMWNLDYSIFDISFQLHLCRLI